MSSLATNALAAFRSLRESPARALLSALGIAVGTIAILLLISIARGVQRDVTQQIEDLGVNVLVVLPGRIDSSSMFNMNLGGQSYLRAEDADRVRGVPGVVRAAPMTFVGGGIRVGEKEAYPFIVATGPEWFEMRPVNLAEGRLFGAGERNESVAVIGSVAKEQLFGSAQAVGRTLQVNGKPYRVVGVTQDKQAEQSLFSMGSFENVVYIPYERHQAVSKNVQTDRIMIQSAPAAEPDSLVAALESALAQRLDRQQYSVLTQKDLLGMVYKLMGILTWLLTGLTSIALFVGGVGIMTVMWMSVNERAKEIGIRKTVGARRGDIFQQFLVEAVALALAGGLAGLALSAVVCYGLYLYTPIKPWITFGTVLLAFGVSVGIGGVFGLLPAMRAARRDPVQALRME